MPFHALPCPALPCPALPCHALPCHALTCHATPRHATPCHATPRHAMPCHHTAHLREEGAVGRVRCEDLVEGPAVDRGHVGTQRLEVRRLDHDGEGSRAPHGLRQPQKGLF